MLRSVPHSLAHTLSLTLPLFHSVIAISAEQRLFIPGHAECKGTAHLCKSYFTEEYSFSSRYLKDQREQGKKKVRKNIVWTSFHFSYCIRKSEPAGCVTGIFHPISSEIVLFIFFSCCYLQFHCKSVY